MKNLLERYFKKIDKANRIVVPSSVVQRHGNEFYLEMYEDVIVLVPVNIKKKGN